MNAFRRLIDHSMFHRIGLLLLLPLAVFASPSAERYFPLKPGSRWVWDITVTTPDGDVSKTTGTRQIGSEVVRSGNSYIQMLDSMQIPGSEAHAVLCRVDDAGVFILEEQRAENTEQCDIVLPLKTGQIWNKTFMGRPSTSTVLGLEILQIGAVSYEDCYHIRTQSDDGACKQDFWLAPDVGMVKAEITSKGGGRMLLRLREFKPAAK